MLSSGIQHQSYFHAIVLCFFKLLLANVRNMIPQILVFTSLVWFEWSAESPTNKTNVFFLPFIM